MQSDGLSRLPFPVLVAVLKASIRMAIICPDMISVRRLRKPSLCNTIISLRSSSLQPLHIRVSA